MQDRQTIIEIVQAQHQFFKTGKTLAYAFRLQQLKKLRAAIYEFEDELLDALQKDLGKPVFESIIGETGFVLMDINETISSLKKWMKVKRVRTPFVMWPGRSQVYYQPLGVNLVIAPFNYPFGLSIAPLIAAIAAGNTVVLKTSEQTPTTSRVIKKLIDKTFEPGFVACVEGAVEETTLLLQQKFDHIFFTGSVRVGSIIMSAAAKQLTPVTLELGGKSPCVVHRDADLDMAVRRIVYGKFLNAGQTCIAPDYVVVHRDIRQDFLQRLEKRLHQLYGNDARQSPDYARIVDQKHLQRLLSLLDKDKVAYGGSYDLEQCYLEPTVLKHIELDDAIMQDEIFGPVLPVLEYNSLQEVFDMVEQLPHYPLAAYIFTRDKDIEQAFIQGIPYGGGCINHCLQHVGNLHLPFGGVGNSGIGNYHGFNGFETFSHKKSIYRAVTWFDYFSLLYPPYTRLKVALVKKLLK